MGGKRNGSAKKGACLLILNGRGDGALEESRRALSRAVEESSCGGEIEAWELAVRQSFLNLLEKRRGSKLEVRKMAGGSSQGAQKGSRGSGHHAAQPKATMP
jgi:hypothetical protein